MYFQINHETNDAIVGSLAERMTHKDCIFNRGFSSRGTGKRDVN